MAEIVFEFGLFEAGRFEPRLFECGLFEARRFEPRLFESGLFETRLEFWKLPQVGSRAEPRDIFKFNLPAGRQVSSSISTYPMGYFHLRHPNSVIGHSVIDVNSIGVSNIIPSISACGKYNITNSSNNFIIQFRSQNRFF